MNVADLIHRTAGGSGGLALVGDLGGTNLRLGLVDLGDPTRVMDAQNFECRWFASAGEVIAAYLKTASPGRFPTYAVIACAGPVTHGAVTLTNLNWTVTEADLRAMGFVAARLINDYLALSMGAPLLTAGDLHRLGGPEAGDPAGTLAVVGAGTGFGVSALGRDSFGHAALATEGGHVAFAPVDDLEIEILQRLHGRFGRVSVERILSGPGICVLHEVLSEIEKAPVRATDPKAITAAAGQGDAAALRTMRRFCAVLGSVAGDMALAFGASGGVFIAGGIAPAIVDILAEGEFRRRFEAKGRFAEYMKAIPTHVIMREHVALLGAMNTLRQMSRAPA